MRVVLDTNVLVSGLLNPHGPPGRVVDAVLAGTITVLYDDRIISEYREVLPRPPFKLLPADIHALLDFMEKGGAPAVAPPLAVVLPDVTDLPFLEVAVCDRADALVTGNVKHFRPRRGRHTVEIWTPAEFLVRLTHR